MWEDRNKEGHRERRERERKRKKRHSVKGGESRGNIDEENETGRK